MAEKKVDNVKINVIFSEEQELKELKSGEGLSVLIGKLAKVVKNFISHFADGVKHISATERAAWNGKADKSEIPNQNLLYNSDFKINSRGKSEYTERGYTVDRWFLNSDTISVSLVSGKIQMKPKSTLTKATQGLIQQIAVPERLITSNSVTLSICISQGVSATVSANGGVSEAAYLRVYAKEGDTILSNTNVLVLEEGIGKITLSNIPSETTMLEVATIYTAGMTVNDVVVIDWVKLEYGNIATPYVSTNPMVENLKCTPTDNPERKILYGDGLWRDVTVGHNLLHNPDFRINQRGKTEYSDYGYTVDRWTLYKPSEISTTGTFTIIPNGIQITSGGTALDTYLIQILDEQVDYVGKPVTLSFNVSELSGTFRFGQRSAVSQNYYNIDRNGLHTFTFIWSETADTNKKHGLFINNLTAEASMKIHWIKLEFGSVATPYIPPDPSLELLKCQRYCIALTGDIAKAYTMNNNALYFIIPISVPMRANPSIENGVIPLIKTYGQSTTTEGFNYQFISKATPNRLIVNATKDSHGIPISTGGILMIPTGERLILSANL